jgi:Protein of unknown function (DUF2690)
MRASLRRPLTAAAMVLATVVSGVAVFAPAAAASTWDSRFPTSWIKRAFFVGTGRPSTLRVDAQWAGGAGSPVHLWDATNDPAQIWVEEPAAEGGYFYHPGYDRWLCLDFDGERGWGNPVKVNACDASSSQRWYWSDRSANATEYGTWLTTHSDNQFCVDVPNSNFVAGQTLQVWGCNGGAAQRWYLSGCLRVSCNGRDPEPMGCSLNSVTVRDISISGDRVTLHWGSRCQSVWGRIGAVVQQPADRSVVVEQYYNGVHQTSNESVAVPAGWVAWTAMFGEGSGYTFRACYREPLYPVYGPCTSLFE